MRCFQANRERTLEMPVPMIVTQCAPLLPMKRPPRPAMIAPANGASTIAR